MGVLIEFETHTKRVMLQPDQIAYVAEGEETTFIVIVGGGEVELPMSYDDFRARLFRATAPRRFQED